MILLVTYLEEWFYDLHGNKLQKRPYPVQMVSHGVDTETCCNVCLPSEELSHFTGKVHIDGEWYII